MVGRPFLLNGVYLKGMYAMEMKIVPFERVGDLIFGTERERVREILGPNFRTYRKASFSTNDTDAYRELGLYLYYNQHDELEFVEMSPLATPTFKGINLFEGDIQSMVRVLQEFDPDPEIDEVGCIFHKIGIALYSEREDGKIEAVSAFARNYYAT
jgi:hypothetical protein